MRYRPIFIAIGVMLCLLGLAMLPSMVIDIVDGRQDWPVFGLSAFLCISLGGVLAIASRGGMRQTSAREAFLLTVLVWVVLPVAAALPLLSLGYGLTDAVFETVSGLTTTGATIVTGLDFAPRGFLLWRAILQWIGGVGIIVTAIAILPMLRVGGMQLFQLESSDVSGKFLPRVAEIATQIGIIYVLLTLLCALCYRLTDMPPFDAVCHAMTTMAAGGFSTHDESMGTYENSHAIWVSIVFMVAAALPFGAFVLMVLHGRSLALLKDPQPRLFLAILTGAVIFLILYLTVGAGRGLYEGNHFVRDVLFSVISVTTGTGYGVVNYGDWGGFAETMFLALMFVGGCAGSAACGIKVFRIEVSVRALWAYSQRMVRPNRIAPVTYGGRTVSEDVLQSVMIFLFLYFMTFSAAAIGLSLTGLDPLTAISAAATSVSNVGPGLGETIGPSGTFEPLPDTAKWICTIAMLLGRLEFVSVFVVLTPRFWRG